MDWLWEPFALGFQQRALIAGLIAVAMASVVGVWLVLRGMSFFGDAFVHGVVPGIAAAVIFDVNPLLGAGIAALIMVGGIELIHRQTTLRDDTAIGLLFVGMLAVGVIMISLSKSYAGSLTSILFGDALGVTWGDIAVEAAIAAVVVLTSCLLYRPLLALSFNSGKAQTLGMHPRLTHAILLALVALSVIGSFRAIGTLLVFGLMIGPPATSALLARTVGQMIILSLVIGSVSVWAGLLISYYANTAASATMAVLPIGMFFVVMTAQALTRRLRPRGATA